MATIRVRRVRLYVANVMRLSLPHDLINQCPHDSSSGNLLTAKHYSLGGTESEISGGLF